MATLLYISQKKIIINYLLPFFAIVSIAFCMQSCEKEKQINYQKAATSKETKAYIKKLIKKGDSLFDEEKNDSALFYLNKAQSLCNPKADDTEDYVYALTLIANIQQNLSDYYTSEETLTKTLPYLKKIKNPRSSYNVYTLIAYNYFYNYDFNTAIFYHKKALKLAKKPFKRAMILTDMAIIYSQQGNLKEAIRILEPLAEKEIKHETNPERTKIQHSVIINNLGVCYLRMNDPRALKYLNKSLTIILEMNDHYELMGTYHSLSYYYFKNNNISLATMYAEKSYYHATKANSATQKANTLSLLIKCGKGESLKKNSLLYINLLDSIMATRKKAKNQSYNIKYSSQKDKAENLELKNEKAENELQLQRQKNRNIILYSLITLAVMIILFLYFYLSTKGKKEKKDAIYKSETRISKRLEDELSNDVFQTIAFAKTQNLDQTENKEHLLNSLNTIYSRTRNISKENSTVLTNEKYQATLKEMIGEFKTPDLNILVNGIDTILWNKIDKNKKIAIYRVIQELFTNMKKHSDATLVSTVFKMIDQNLVITYIDNGTGTQKGKLILKNGLQNVENRIKTVNGTINFETISQKGFKVSIRFPL